MEDVKLPILYGNRSRSPVQTETQIDRRPKVKLQVKKKNPFAISRSQSSTLIGPGSYNTSQAKLLKKQPAYSFSQSTLEDRDAVIRELESHCNDLFLSLNIKKDALNSSLEKEFKGVPFGPVGISQSFYKEAQLEDKIRNLSKSSSLEYNGSQRRHSTNSSNSFNKIGLSPMFFPRIGDTGEASEINSAPGPGTYTHMSTMIKPPVSKKVSQKSGSHLRPSDYTLKDIMLELQEANAVKEKIVHATDIIIKNRNTISSINADSRYKEIQENARITESRIENARLRVYQNNINIRRKADMFRLAKESPEALNQYKQSLEMTRKWIVLSCLASRTHLLMSCIAAKRDLEFRMRCLILVKRAHAKFLYSRYIDAICRIQKWYRRQLFRLRFISLISRRLSVQTNAVALIKVFLISYMRKKYASRFRQSLSIMIKKAIAIQKFWRRYLIRRNWKLCALLLCYFKLDSKKPFAVPKVDFFELRLKAPIENITRVSDIEPKSSSSFKRSTSADVLTNKQKLEIKVADHSVAIAPKSVRKSSTGAFVDAENKRAESPDVITRKFSSTDSSLKSPANYSKTKLTPNNGVTIDRTKIISQKSDNLSENIVPAYSVFDFTAVPIKNKSDLPTLPSPFLTTPKLSSINEISPVSEEIVTVENLIDSNSADAVDSNDNLILLESRIPESRERKSSTVSLQKNANSSKAVTPAASSTRKPSISERKASVSSTSGATPRKNSIEPSEITRKSSNTTRRSSVKVIEDSEETLTDNSALIAADKVKITEYIRVYSPRPPRRNIHRISFQHLYNLDSYFSKNEHALITLTHETSDIEDLIIENVYVLSSRVESMFWFDFERTSAQDLQERKSIIESNFLQKPSSADLQAAKLIERKGTTITTALLNMPLDGLREDIVKDIGFDCDVDFPPLPVRNKYWKLLFDSVKFILKSRTEVWLKNNEIYRQSLKPDIDADYILKQMKYKEQVSVFLSGSISKSKLFAEKFDHVKPEKSLKEIKPGNYISIIFSSSEFEKVRLKVSTDSGLIDFAMLKANERNNRE